MNTSKEVILDAANSMVEQLRKERDELKDRLKDAHQLLKKVEWVGFGMCWICGNNFNIGHKPNCELAAELKEGK